MTKPTSPKPNPDLDENTVRFRTILSATEDEEATRQSAPSRVKPNAKPDAPKRKAPASRSPSTFWRNLSSKQGDGWSKWKQPAETPPTSGERAPAGSSGGRRFGPAFWTITGIMSLVVNAVLIAVVIILLGVVSNLNIKLNQILSYAKLPEDTVRGLYDNFVKMDQAHIRTEIEVSSEIPVQFDLALDTDTEVVLSRDTRINQARVTLSTGTMNITDAPANIILPAGTVLPVHLTLTVPVDKRVPVNLIVPVDIALADTDLHDPFIGLRMVVEPLYCMFEPALIAPDGTLSCEQAAP